MILQTAELSSNQKVAIEELLGCQLLDQDAISLRTLPATSASTRQAATEKLRTFLEQADRPRAGVSDEECEAALLEAMRSERPHYTPMP